MRLEIVHRGVVREIRGQMVVVGIEVVGACEGCKVQGLCGLSGEPEKEVAVYDREAANYREGDEVVVGIGSAMALKAVVWAYVAPFFLMLATLLTVKGMGAGELMQGAATLGVAVVYYLVLWLLKGRLERDIIFKIEKYNG